MPDVARRRRSSGHRLQICGIFGIVSFIIAMVAKVHSKARRYTSHGNEIVNFHLILDNEPSERALRMKFKSFTLYPCILHLYSHIELNVDGIDTRCSVTLHRLFAGATWMDIPLGSGRNEMIVREDLNQITNEEIKWIEKAKHSVNELETDGARRDVAAFVILCSNGKPCIVCPHANRGGKLLWKEFQEWYGSHRAEWRIWPHITKEYDVTPRFRRSRSNKKRDPNLTRIGQLVGHVYTDESLIWNVWFDRWAKSYSLRAIVGRRDDLKHSTGVAWDKNEFREDENGESYMNALKSIVSAASDGNRVVMTIVDSAFQDITKNWLCNVKSGGFLPSGIVWLTLSEDVKDMLDGTGIGKTIDLTRALKNPEDAMPNILYGHKTYWKLMLLRTRLIADLVERGVQVFLFETDQTWLKDPFVDIERELRAGADMVGTLDTQHNVAGNTLYLKPTLPTRKLWSEVYRRFKASYDAVGVESMDESENSFVEHDQHSLSDLLLYNEEFRRENPVALGLLNADFFVGGSWYSGFYNSEESKTPVIINNNFISGVRKKKKRAIEFGHWFIDRNGRCLPHAVEKALRYEFPNGPPVRQDP